MWDLTQNFARHEALSMYLPTLSTRMAPRYLLIRLNRLRLVSLAVEASKYGLDQCAYVFMAVSLSRGYLADKIFIIRRCGPRTAGRMVLDSENGNIHSR
jgi:hypothetical protein